MKLLKSKKLILVLSIFLISLTTIFIGIDLTFNKPTKLNKIVAAKRYKTSGTPVNTAFKDQNFYNCVVDAYNKENGTSVAYTENLSNEQLETIEDLVCYGYDKKNIEKIINVNGIEKLVNLERLSLTDNLITNIDLSKNTKLYQLMLAGNKLTELDVSQNVNLSSLDIGFWSSTSFSGASGKFNGNNISKLNLSNNVNLVELYVNNNKLTSLDLSNNVKLNELYVNNNQLTSLDVSNNPSLKKLRADNNQLTSLDVSNNPSLTELNASSNQLTSLDASKAPALKELDISYNNITTINLSKNSLLYYAQINNNKLTEIDVTNNTKLKDLNLMFNDISSIDVTQNIDLEILEIISKDLTQLDVTNNVKLTELFLATTPINNIDLSNNPELKKFSLYEGMNGMRLTELDINKNTKLVYLDIHNNNLTKIDLSNNLELTNINISNNQLTEIDLSNNPKLTSIKISNNKLTEIDLRNNKKLAYLYVNGNLLTSLDVTSNLELKTLFATYNQLATLDVSNNPLLTELSVFNNPFIRNIVLYKDIEKSLNDVNFIKLPEGKTANVSEISLNNENIIINNDLIKINKAGTFSVNSRYQHNIMDSSYNYYSGTYNITVIEATSDKYEINSEEGYIYTKADTESETILSNINLNYGKATIEDNKVIIKYENEIIKEFDIVNISSEKYDLTKDYIFEYKDNNITINNGIINKNTENNTLEIKYGEDILQTYKLVDVYSGKYDLTKDYIYIGNEKLDISKINITNGTLLEDDNILKIKYQEEVLKTFDLIDISFGKLSVFNKYIVLTDELTYDDVIINITGNVTYKVYNNEEEVNEIGENYKLYVYYNDEKVDEYTFTTEYLTFNEELESKIDKDNNYILGNEIGTKVSDIKSLIDTSGSISFVDKDNKELTDDSKIGTGSKVKISLSTGDVYYELVVTGDTSGDGKLTVSDLVKINNHIISEDKKLEGVYALASDYDGNGRITVSDIVKINNKILGGN